MTDDKESREQTTPTRPPRQEAPIDAPLRNGDDPGRGAAAAEDEGRPPNAASAGVWSRQRLRSRIQTGNLITHDGIRSAFRDERLDAASYGLTMGPEVYVSPASEETRPSVKMLKEAEPFVIPPGQFAFLLTEEVVEVPADALAFIALRSKKTKFRGLVNVSGFHADPGYFGRLIYAVFNAGPADVHLRRGDALFTIFYTDLTERTEKPRARQGGFLNIPADLISPIGGQIQSFEGLRTKIDEVEDDLDERLQKLEREGAIVRWATALILGALVALLVRGLTVEHRPTLDHETTQTSEQR